MFPGDFVGNNRQSDVTDMSGAPRSSYIHPIFELNMKDADQRLSGRFLPIGWSVQVSKAGLR